jgi:hypothetical protein
MGFYHWVFGKSLMVNAQRERGGDFFVQTSLGAASVTPDHENQAFVFGLELAGDPAWILHGGGPRYLWREFSGCHRRSASREDGKVDHNRLPG